jgi:hypothetical protein
LKLFEETVKLFGVEDDFVRIVEGFGDICWAGFDLKMKILDLDRI